MTANIVMLASVVVLSSFGGNTTWRKTIAGPSEPGERMIITGVALLPDGKTPARGVRLTVYHTDATGIYPPEHAPDGGEPRLRGTVVTNDEGRYEIRTIRPAPYPGGRNAAHVHYIVEAGKGRRQLATLLFADDPATQQSERRRIPGKGYTGEVQEPERGKDGVWRIRKDILTEE